jgi:hypothetical protein
MGLRICDREIYNLRTLGSESVSGWDGWRARQRWSQLWSPLPASVEWMCTSSFASPGCLGIHGGAILATKAAGRVVLTKHYRVSLYRSLHFFMPRKLNTQLLLFLDLIPWFLNVIFHFLYCGVRKAFFGHFNHIQRQAHVRLFQLYLTSLPCHSFRHVENLQRVSCCVQL